ncbi:MAG: histidinol-phosphate transaminase [Clostridia bacterium]|nr:histidinol-phosphate transaminase [Clostridia bacterium]
MKSRLAKKLIPYVPGEQPKNGNFIKLNTNENPYPPSPKAVKALSSYDTVRLRLYPNPTAISLRESLADYENVKTENVFVGNGSDEVLSLAFASFFDGDGAPVLFPDVTYSFYTVFCSLYGINYKQIPLCKDFSLDVNDYIGRETTGIVIANPNAPTAISIAGQDIRKLLEAYPDKVIIIDEAYVDFSRHPSVAPLTKEYPNLLVVKTFSKSRSMAGSRLGYAIGNQALINTLRTVKDCFNSYPVNSLTALMGEESVKDDEYFVTNVKKIISTREIVKAELFSMGYEVTDSDANFLFARHPEKSGKYLQEKLRESNIIVRRFDAPRISDYLRITIGSEDEMQAFLSALKNL